MCCCSVENSVKSAHKCLTDLFIKTTVCLVAVETNAPVSVMVNSWKKIAPGVLTVILHCNCCFHRYRECHTSTSSEISMITTFGMQVKDFKNVNIKCRFGPFLSTNLTLTPYNSSASPHRLHTASRVGTLRWMFNISNEPMKQTTKKVFITLVN